MENLVELGRRECPGPAVRSVPRRVIHAKLRRRSPPASGTRRGPDHLDSSGELDACDPSASDELPGFAGP